MKILGKNNENELVEVEISISAIMAQLDAIKKYPTGYERMEDGNFYWTWDSTAHEVIEVPEVGDSEAGTASLEDYKDGQYYADMELAMANARADRLFRNIRRFAALKEGIVPFGSDSGWEIVYDSAAMCPVPRYVGDNARRSIGDIWFSSLRTCTECIVEFRDELVWYFKEYVPVREGWEEIIEE